MKTLATLVAISSVGLFVAIGGCNTNYGDLMRVTSTVDASIASEEVDYRSGASVAERTRAREQIIKYRKKQLVMAQRIAVGSMPEVEHGAMSLAQGEAKKAEFVAAAQRRYDDALALPIPTANDISK